MFSQPISIFVFFNFWTSCSPHFLISELLMFGAVCLFYDDGKAAPVSMAAVWRKRWETTGKEFLCCNRILMVSVGSSWVLLVHSVLILGAFVLPFRPSTREVLRWAESLEALLTNQCKTQHFLSVGLSQGGRPPSPTPSCIVIEVIVVWARHQ